MLVSITGFNSPAASGQQERKGLYSLTRLQDDQSHYFSLNQHWEGK